MTIQETIKKAFEGGWKCPNGYIGEECGCVDEVGAGNEDKLRQSVLDPLFWQALGKNMGWEDCRCEQCHDVFPEYHNGCVRCGKSIRADPFMRYHWHRFIDHLVDGKDIDSFFNQL